MLTRAPDMVSDAAPIATMPSLRRWPLGGPLLERSSLFYPPRNHKQMGGCRPNGTHTK